MVSVSPVSVTPDSVEVKGSLAVARDPIGCTYGIYYIYILLIKGQLDRRLFPKKVRTVGRLVRLFCEWREFHCESGSGILDRIMIKEDLS